MSIVFISDLHLAEDNGLLEPFVQFLSGLPKDTHAVYILGDFFNVWIGDDDDNAFNHTVCNVLRDLTAEGMPVYFQHGNRDFLLGERFFQYTGLRLLPEEYVLEVAGIRFLLMHGDTLCTLDKRYQTMRKLFRMKWLQFLFRRLPLSFRRSIAQKLRGNSMRYTELQTHAIMDVTEVSVLDAMRRHHVTRLIHGHTHRMGVHEMHDQGKKLLRFVLPAWHDHASALVLDDMAEVHWVPIF